MAREIGTTGGQLGHEDLVLHDEEFEDVSILPAMPRERLAVLDVRAFEYGLDDEDQRSDYTVIAVLIDAETHELLACTFDVPPVDDVGAVRCVQRLLSREALPRHLALIADSAWLQGGQAALRSAARDCAIELSFVPSSDDRLRTTARFWEALRGTAEASLGPAKRPFGGGCLTLRLRPAEMDLLIKATGEHLRARAFAEIPAIAET